MKPLYDELHCYARARLARRYGEDKVPAGRPIPAHLLGNMWAQTLEQRSTPTSSSPTRPSASRPRTRSSRRRSGTRCGWRARPRRSTPRSASRRCRRRSGSARCCHGRATARWCATRAPGTCTTRQDVRIKMCIEPNEEDLCTIYHELGHVYLLPALQATSRTCSSDGAQRRLPRGDRRHGRPVGDAGLPGARSACVRPWRRAARRVINQQMKMALDKIAFLPFGAPHRPVALEGVRRRDHARQLQQRVVGAARRSTRAYRAAGRRAREDDFDPGAKYHVPANTPYMRYFLVRHPAVPVPQGAVRRPPAFKGRCTSARSTATRPPAPKFAQMLSLGASEPWQDALEKLTGSA